MYEIAYGSKYNKDLDVVAIAKLIRADIKAAVKAGELAAAKYSVRIDKFSGGQSIDITVSAMAFEVLREARVLAEHDEPHAYSGLNWQSDAAVALDKKLAAIMAAYNYDGSDIQSDYFNVNFYGHVRLEYDGDAERKAILARNGRAA